MQNRHILSQSTTFLPTDLVKTAKKICLSVQTVLTDLSMQERIVQASQNPRKLTPSPVTYVK